MDERGSDPGVSAGAGRRARRTSGQRPLPRPRWLVPAVVTSLVAVGMTMLTSASASAATATVSSVGGLITHTNQPSLATESVTVSPAATGDLLAVAVETKFPGSPSFTASTISGGGVSGWTRADAFLTADGFHGQELWWGTVTSTGARTLTVSYTSGATAGTSESASSVDVQEFSSSAGASTVWSVDTTGRDDSGIASTTLRYPSLSPSSPPETYFGYLAVPGSITAGTSSGVTYQTDARYNQVAYATGVTGTIAPTASSSSQTYASIGMLLRASTAADTTAPSVPTGLAVSGTPTASSVSLTWSASTDNSGGSGVAGYRVFRNGSTTPLNTALATTTSYTDTTPAAGTTYSYTVAAVDNAGNQSAPSTAVSATTPAAGGGTGGGTGGATTITNGGFETGSLSGWTATGAITGVTTVAHSGSYSALLGSTNASNGDSSIAQTFTAPAGSPTVSFYWQSVCPDTVAYDWSTATLKDNTTGATTTPLAKTCTTSSTWTQVTTPLTGGHSYTLTLTNHDENYPGDATYTRYDDVTVSGGTTTADTTAPSVPTGLAVSGTPTASSVSLTWSASTDNSGGSGVAGYRVFRNGSTTPLNTALATTTSYTDTTAAAGTTYSYTVAAVDNAGNQSAPSTAVSATTPTAADTTAPSVPTGLAVSGTPTASSVSLTWSASTDNSGGSGVAGYRVFRNGSTTPLNTALATTTSYTDTTPAAGTTYSYTVAAVDNAGNQSAPSTAVSATTPAAGGGTGGGTGGATTITNGGFETGSLSGWTATGAITGVTTVAHSGSYSALLGSTNASNGDSSIAQTFTAPAGSPTVSFYWQSVCPDTVAYDWSTATLKDNTTGATTTPLAKTCTTSSTWTQVTTPLTGGHSYTLTLTNHDENYPGDATYTRYDDVTVSGGTTTADTTAPSVPTGLAVSGTPTASSVSLTWSASTDNSGGSGVAGYRVFRNGSTTPLNTALATTTSYTDTTAAAGTTYSYTVAAVDNAGNQSAPSTAVSATTPTAADTTAPSVPTGLAVSGTPTASSVSLTWSASTDNSGGSGVAGYRVFRNGSTTPLNTALATTTSYTDTTPAAGTTYSYTVAAVDNAGNQSAPSTAVSATTPAAGGGTGGGTGGATTITNGGFETGSLSGWTATGAITGVTTVAHSGSYSALLGSTNASNGDSSIAQTFTAPAGSPTVSFYWQSVCPDTVAYDWSTATLKDNTTGATTTPLAKTCTTSSTWTQVTTPLTGGHSYTLTLTNHDENYPGDATYTRYDDVTVR